MADNARAARMAKRIQTIVASAIEREVKDRRLELVTVTDTRVTGDLHDATVFYTVFGDDAQRERSAEVLEANRGKLRSFVGKQLGIRLTPTLELLPDAVPENASHIDDLLRSARERDEDLARARSTATPAGEADPYRTKDEGEDSPPSSFDA